METNNNNNNSNNETDINNNIHTTTTTTTTTTNNNNNNNNNESIVGEEQVNISPQNETILMVPEIDMDTPQSTTPNIPTIQQQSIEEQQQQHLQNEQLRSNEYKVTQLSIESENDKKNEQEQTQEQQEGYGNDEVTEMVLKNVLYVSNKVLSGAQYVGNIFADILGFGEHKYQDHLDEYNMIQEEKKRKMEKEAKTQSDMESGIQEQQTKESSISVSSSHN